MNGFRPGDVTPQGDIVCQDGVLLRAGAVYVSLVQALRAYRHGWRIRNAICRKNGTFFVIQR